MAGGEDEAVAVEPLRRVRVLAETAAVEDGADFRAAERQAEVAGVAGMDGVHGEAARLGRGLREDGGIHWRSGLSDRRRRVGAGSLLASRKRGSIA